MKLLPKLLSLNSLGRSIRQITHSPLLWQEVRRLLRSQKAFWFLLGFLGVLLYQVHQNWNHFASQWAPDGNIAAGSRDLFYKLSQAHLLLFTLFTPFLMTPSIVSEREQETFELLVSSPITILHVIVAKLFSPLVFVLLLISSAAPVLSLSFIGGGLSMGEVFRTYLIMLTAIINLGLLGLFCSTLRRRVYEVYLIAALLTLFYALILPFHGGVWNYVSTVSHFDLGVGNHGFQYLSPFFALQEEIYPSANYVGMSLVLTNPMKDIYPQWPSTFTVGYVFLVYLIVWLLSSFFLLVITYRRVMSIVYQTRAESTPVPKEEEADPVYIYERDYTLSFSAKSEQGNPGLVLEKRVQWFARFSVLLRLFYLALIISVITLPLVSYEGSWLFLSLPFIVAAFFTLPLAATSISADRERGTLDMLRTTLISAREIVQAKFITNLNYSFFIALALYLPGLSILLICSLLLDYELDLVYNWRDFFVLFWYPVILYYSMVLYTCIGLFCSAYFQQTNRALIFSGLLILLCLLGPSPVPGWNLASLSLGRGRGSIGLSFFSPLAILAILFPEGRVKLFGKVISLSWASGDTVYLLAALQGILSLLLARLLYWQTIRVIQRQD